MDEFSARRITKACQKTVYEFEKGKFNRNGYKYDQKRHVMYCGQSDKIMRLMQLIIIFGVYGMVAALPPVATGASRGISQKSQPEQVEPASPASLIIHCPSIYVNYRIDTPVEYLNRVELWFARGFDKPWRLYGFDSDKTSPIKFTAPAEGIYRLLVVAIDNNGRPSYTTTTPNYRHNEMGLPPDVQPQKIVFIDYTPPKILFMQAIVNVDIQRQLYVQLNWAGYDDHLGAKPTQIWYITREPTGRGWLKIGREFPATGQYTWSPPAGLSGEIKFRAVLTDQSGLWTARDTDWVEISPPKSAVALKLLPQEKEKKSSYRTPKAVSAPQKPDKTRDATIQQPTNTNKSTKPAASKDKPVIDAIDTQAQNYFIWGSLYQQRMEWDKAAEAYRKALSVAPRYFDCLFNLAEVLYKAGKYQQAGETYQKCLDIESQHLSSLYGLAQCKFSLKDYIGCRKTLKTLLQLDRRDWQAWLLLGDAAREIGKPEEAINSWQQASQSQIPFIVRAAQERIENYRP